MTNEFIQLYQSGQYIEENGSPKSFINEYNLQLYEQRTIYITLRYNMAVTKSRRQFLMPCALFYKYPFEICISSYSESMLEKHFSESQCEGVLYHCWRSTQKETSLGIYSLQPSHWQVTKCSPWHHFKF